MLSYMAIGFGEPREVTRGRMVEVRTNSEDELEDREGECREMEEKDMREEENHDEPSGAGLKGER